MFTIHSFETTNSSSSPERQSSGPKNPAIRSLMVFSKNLKLEDLRLNNHLNLGHRQTNRPPK
jgi:hypothetical protein